MTTQRRQSTAALTREAVRWLMGPGEKTAEAARPLGSQATRLRRWHRDGVAADTAALPGHGRRSPAPAARRRRREDHTRRRMERDRCNNATAVLATESSGGMP